MAEATLTKENISLGLAYSFRGSVHYRHGGKHGSVRADTVLEKKLRVLHLIHRQQETDFARQEARGSLPHWWTSSTRSPQSLFPQRRGFSKATPPNGAPSMS